MPEQVVRVGVTDFVTYAYEDLQDATNSRFIQKILQLRKTVDSIAYDLDLDKAALNKVRKSVKSVYGSGKTHIQSESDLSNLLAELGNYAIDEGADSVGSALSKFSVVTKETNSYFANLMQNLSNIVLSPLETFIKVEMKSDAKKGFDKALKEYESKFDKIKKEKIQAAKEAGHAKTDVPMSEIQEELERERRLLQLQLCEFFIKANDVKTKKRSSLMQYFIDYYTAQLMYFEESLKTLKHLGCYMQDMVSTVDELRTEQDEERRTLVKLRDELRNSMAERDTPGALTGSLTSASAAAFVAGSSATIAASSSSAAAASSVAASGAATYSLHQSQGNRAHGTCKIGYLMKRSEGKVKKVWQKRRAAVEEDRFLLYHADESKPPVSLLLLTCQVRQSPEDRSKRAFRLISNNRTYYFQCDSPPEAEHWVSVLNNAKEKVFQAAMGAPLLSASSAGVAGGGDGSDGGVGGGHGESLRAAIIREIRGLPGNNVCADCCTPDPEWISTNLGVLICLECCGIHRDLGVHISRTQSLVMDDLTTAQLLVARFVGNKLFNEIFEAVLPDNVKPRCSVANSADLQQLMDTRKIFIRAKYVDRCYVYRTTDRDAVEGLQSLKGDLLKAVRHQNMSLLLQAFAEGCDLLSQYTDGETALHVLLREGDECVCLAIVDFMLQNSSPQALKRATVSGETLLHYCVNYNRPDCLKLCLRTSLSACHGARSHNGLTAGDTCEQLSLQICADLLRAVDTGNTDLFEHMTNFDWRLPGCSGGSGGGGSDCPPDYCSDEEGPIFGGGGGGGDGDFPQLRTLTAQSAASTGGGTLTLSHQQRRGWSYYPSPSKSSTSTPKSSGHHQSTIHQHQHLLHHQASLSSSTASSTAAGGSGSYGSGFVTLPRRPSKVKKAPPPPQTTAQPQAAPRQSTDPMMSSLYGVEALFHPAGGNNSSNNNSGGGGGGGGGSSSSSYRSPMPANPNRSNGDSRPSPAWGQQHQQQHRHPLMKRAGSYDNIDVIIDALMEDPDGENTEDPAGKQRPQPLPRHTLHKAVPDGPTDPDWSSPRIAIKCSKPMMQQQQQPHPSQTLPPKRAPKPKIDKSLLLQSAKRTPAQQPQQPQQSQQQEQQQPQQPPAPIASSDSDAESVTRASLPSSPQQTPQARQSQLELQEMSPEIQQQQQQQQDPLLPMRCVAMYDCRAEFPNELSFVKGEILTVTRKENEDWWEAEIEDEPARHGLFPVSFVHFLS